MEESRRRRAGEGEQAERRAGGEESRRRRAGEQAEESRRRRASEAELFYLKTSADHPTSAEASRSQLAATGWIVHN